MREVGSGQAATNEPTVLELTAKHGVGAVPQVHAGSSAGLAVDSRRLSVWELLPMAGWSPTDPHLPRLPVGRPVVEPPTPLPGDSLAHASRISQRTKGPNVGTNPPVESVLGVEAAHHAALHGELHAG